MAAETQSQEVRIQVGDLALEGSLSVPEWAGGLVVFAHGSGSSRLSPRNRYVADVLNDGGLGTLLFDLLTVPEHEVDLRTAELRFDITLLGERLTATLDWLREQPRLRHLPVGLFGASTGAAAALVAAAQRPEMVKAVVSRGGRPDLAGPALAEVRAAVLLIVGGADVPVIGMNQEAAARLACEHNLQIIPGATHLFEEPGTLEQVAAQARDFFRRKLEHARD